jgi:hypothetical protein
MDIRMQNNTGRLQERISEWKLKVHVPEEAGETP